MKWATWTLQQKHRKILIIFPVIKEPYTEFNEENKTAFLLENKTLQLAYLPMIYNDGNDLPVPEILCGLLCYFSFPYCTTEKAVTCLRNLNQIPDASCDFSHPELTWKWRKAKMIAREWMKSWMEEGKKITLHTTNSQHAPCMMNEATSGCRSDIVMELRSRACVSQSGTGFWWEKGEF